MGKMYCIGDIHGCYAEFQELLHALDFSPSRDTLYILGDMVNRGPQSADVLRSLMALEGSAHCLLGNHDIHLLAAAQGIRRLHPRDTLREVLDTPDAHTLLHWLRHRPLALYANNCLMVHAGVLPQWTVTQTLQCAQEIEQAFQVPNARDRQNTLQNIFGNEPSRWNDDLCGIDRLRCSLNALTRGRMLTRQGGLDFAFKQPPQEAPPELVPWFTYPNRKTANTLVAFGHWSALGLVRQEHVLALDTGCAWGGKLSAAEISPTGRIVHIVQVDARVSNDL